MESTQTDQMIYGSDVRQSPAWAEYLKAIKWQSYRTSKNINIEIRPTFMGSFVKIQKVPRIDANDLNEIETICKEHKAEFIKIEPYIGQDVDLLVNAGYEISWFPLTPPSTFFIDLKKSESDLWSAISKSGKYRIHRAQREGAKVEFIQNPNQEQLQKFYKVLKETGKLKSFYVPPIKQIYSQAAAFGDMGFLAFVTGPNDVLLGAKWCCAYDKTVLYISGGTTSAGRGNHSGYELLWKSILYFKSLGFEIFDLEGKDDPRFPGLTKRWGGFSHFKEKFGGIAVEFPHPRVKYIGKTFKFLHKFLGFAV